MRVFFLAIILALLSPLQSALAQPLPQEAAVALAEEFIVENGYTKATRDRIKQQLVFESIERAHTRDEMLRRRYNTLSPKAIGAKRGRKGSNDGWSIAFDHVPASRDEQATCRVVTMNADGSDIRIEHVDGFRKAFALPEISPQPQAASAADPARKGQERPRSGEWWPWLVLGLLLLLTIECAVATRRAATLEPATPADV